MLGFDHDREDVFEKTVKWVEENRLECATFHIMTPYPGTPLFRQMESEDRLLHTDWSKCDTANVVFRPKHMTAEQLAEGYEWCYQQLFSNASSVATAGRVDETPPPTVSPTLGPTRHGRCRTKQQCCFRRRVKQI